MYTTAYRIVGAYDLTLRARRPRHGAPTLVPIDRAALRDFVLRAARDVGLEPCAMHVADDAVRLIALASEPRAVLELERWVPRLAARPLHYVDQFFAAVTEVRAHADADPLPDDLDDLPAPA